MGTSTSKIFRFLSDGAAFILVLVILNGCAFSKDNDSKDAKGDIIIQQVTPDTELLVDGDFNADVTSEPLSINEYDARISWKSNKPSILQIFVGDNSSEPAKTVNSKNESSFSYRCLPGSTVKFRVVVFPDFSRIPSSEIIAREIQCPLDVEISGKTPFAFSNRKIGKLFFHNNSVMSLDGTNLDLKIDTLIIDRFATIETFDQSTDKRKHNGEKTPHVDIEIGKVLLINKEAIAKLDIRLLGLDGQSGRSGDELGELDPEFLYQKNTPRNGSNGENGRSHLNNSASNPTINNCSSQSTRGGDGLNGLAGYSGENGHDGMDSPSLKLVLKTPTTLFVDVLQLPGRKGHGGAGGKAIPAGKGGSGGITQGDGDKSNCPSMPSGSDGVSYPDGDPGIDGNNGELGSCYLEGVSNYQVHVLPK